MKKVISLLYVFTILFSLFSSPIYAQEIDSSNNDINVENKEENEIPENNLENETSKEENGEDKENIPNEELPKEEIKTKYGIVRSNIGIKVRNGAGTSFQSIGTGIADGQIVTIYEEVTSTDLTDTCPSHKWYKIKYLQVQEEIGYACSDFVEILNLDIDDEFEAVLLTFPESYRENLKLLHAIYPNAVFRVYKTGLDFNEVVENENIEGKNLLWDNNNSKDGLKLLDSYNITTNSFKNNYPGGGSNWYAPSKETITYYIDPRNFLTETRVFMFESLSYNAMYHNVEGVEKTLKNSFMYNTYVDGKNEKKFSDVINLAGLNNGISPFYIASRILQETGLTRSSLVTGNYPNYPEYNGYYNFYNFGATGTEIVKNGLTYAYNKGWNSEEKAILGGASLLGKDYISAGQDTSYTQKWNVVCKTSDYSCYTHQYMQNLEAPYSEASITYNAYKNNLGEDMYDAAYVFTIPVYENMPEKTILPNSESPINYLKTLIVNGSLIANFDSLKTEYSITIPSYITNINIEASSVVNGAKIEGIGNIEIKEDKQIVPIKVTALNGSILTYNITVNLNDDAKMTLEETLTNLKKGNITDNYISGLTNVDIVEKSFNEANSAALIEIKDLNGNIVTDGSLGTGYKVNITVGEEKKELEVIIYGDTNGDAEITILDLLRVQKQLLKSLTLSGSQLTSCDINKDGSVTILDLLLVQKHLLGDKEISQ